MDNSVIVSLRDIVVEFDGQRILDGLQKILDGVRAVAFKPLIEILKGIDQDLLKGAIAGEHFQEQFFADCKDPELAAYVKTLL